MNKKREFSAFITLLLLIIIHTESSAAALTGEWAVTLNLRTRVWNDNGSLRSDKKTSNINNFIFYSNGFYVNEAQPNFEHGDWRKSGNNLRLFPDYNGPTIINGTNNNIIVTNWVVKGKKTRNTIKGSYFMQYTITVVEFFSGVVVVNNVEISGTFKGKKLTAH